MELKNSELKRLSELYKSGMTGAGVKYIEGRGKLIDAHTVQVNGKNYTVGFWHQAAELTESPQQLDGPRDNE